VPQPHAGAATRARIASTSASAGDTNGEKAAAGTTPGAVTLPRHESATLLGAAALLTQSMRRAGGRAPAACE